MRPRIEGSAMLGEQVPVTVTCTRHPQETSSAVGFPRSPASAGECNLGAMHGLTFAAQNSCITSA